MAEGRLKYPLDNNGLPLIPAGISDCYEECKRDNKDTNRHHVNWPREKYKTSVERQFRDSGLMVVRACVCKHANLHATYLPPPMPERFTMIDVAMGDLVPDVAEVFIRRRDA